MNNIYDNDNNCVDDNAYDNMMSIPRIGSSRKQFLGVAKVKDHAVGEEYGIALRNCCSINQDEVELTIDRFIKNHD